MRERIAKKMAYLGAGAGLVVFAIFGLVPGSFIGGVVGLSITGAVFGTPVDPGVITRMILAASMVLGVMISALIIITATTSVGWLIGAAIDALAGSEKKPVAAVRTE